MNLVTLIKLIAWLAAAVFSIMWLLHVCGAGPVPDWVPPAGLLALTVATAPFPPASRA